MAYETNPLLMLWNLLPKEKKKEYADWAETMKPEHKKLSDKTYTASEAAAGASKNKVRSLLDAGEYIGKSLLHPVLRPDEALASVVDLGKAVYQTGRGVQALAPGAKKLTAEELEQTAPVTQVAEVVKNYSDPEFLKRVAAEDPFRVPAEVLAMAAAPGKKGPRVPKPAPKNAHLPSLRDLDRDTAIAIARKEPHLITGGEGTEGKYVGGPRNVQSKASLNKIRRDFDANLARNPVGGDWYDRYRASVGEVTGGDPLHNDWMTRSEAMYSAGVSPEGELGFATKDTNANVAGMPTKAARPAQAEASRAAIAAKSTSPFVLGRKTGQYQRKISPDQGPPSATAVTDFRQARELGYTEPPTEKYPLGKPQSQGLNKTQHTFADYEMALAVDRANKAKMGGRDNWTGDEIQAIPWVIQKGEDFYQRAAAIYRKDAEREIRAQEKTGGVKLDKEAKDAIYAQHAERGRQEKLVEANKTIGDYFDKHTAFGTHESRPGPATGHIPSLLEATPEQIAAYHADPASTWATAPGGRDAVYAGTVIPGTGMGVRTRPTLEMQGLYTDANGNVQYNPGATARPLVAFTNEPKMPKTIPEADRSILQAGETVRAAIDAQDAGAAHKPWLGGPTGKSNSLWVPLDRKLTEGELLALKAKAKEFGYTDVVDTGQGVTITSFGEGPIAQPLPLGKNSQVALSADIAGILPDAKAPVRTSVDSVYAGLPWGEVGSGTVTRTVLDAVKNTPQLEQNFSFNKYLSERAMAKLNRDQPIPGARPDIQNLRAIVGEGPGWPTRLEDAWKSGSVALPAAAVAVPGLLGLPEGEQAGVDFQEDMRRRRAALRGERPAGPVVYQDEERYL